MNYIFREFVILLKTDRRTMTPYHSSSNDIVERVNGTPLRILRLVVADDPLRVGYHIPVS